MVSNQACIAKRRGTDRNIPVSKGPFFHLKKYVCYLWFIWNIPQKFCFISVLCCKYSPTKKNKTFCLNTSACEAPNVSKERQAQEHHDAVDLLEHQWVDNPPLKALLFNVSLSTLGIFWVHSFTILFILFWQPIKILHGSCVATAPLSASGPEKSYGSLIYSRSLTDWYWSSTNEACLWAKTLAPKRAKNNRIRRQSIPCPISIHLYQMAREHACEVQEIQERSLGFAGIWKQRLQPQSWYGS